MFMILRNLRDYGDSRVRGFYDFWSTHSPLELASKAKDPLPHFLLVNGFNDSRVNSAHTFKLYQALRDRPATQDSWVFLASVNNSGHDCESISSEDYKGLWTRLSSGQRFLIFLE